MKNYFFLVTFAAVCVSIGGACHADDRVDLQECSALANTFFKKSLKETMDDFSKRPLPEQYEIYICGNQYIHPPTIHLSEPFAAQGAPAVAYLKGKLATATDAATIRDILQVIAEARRQHSYDVQGDAQLMALAREKSDTVTGPWRQYVGVLIAQIEK